jgi:hypothetical protein
MTSVVPNHADREPLSPADEKRIDRLLAKARTALVLEHPFIGNIALNLPFIPDYSIRTAQTNGKDIRYNPYFMDAFGDEESGGECFVIARMIDVSDIT